MTTNFNTDSAAPRPVKIIFNLYPQKNKIKMKYTTQSELVFITHFYNKSRTIVIMVELMIQISLFLLV